MKAEKLTRAVEAVAVKPPLAFQNVWLGMCKSLKH